MINKKCLKNWGTAIIMTTTICGMLVALSWMWWLLICANAGGHWSMGHLYLVQWLLSLVACSLHIFDSACYCDIVPGWRHMCQPWLSHLLPQPRCKILSRIASCWVRNLSASSAQMSMRCLLRYTCSLMYRFKVYLGWIIACTSMVNEVYSWVESGHL